MVMVLVSFIMTLMVLMITMLTVSTMLMMMIKKYSIVMIRRMQFVGDIDDGNQIKTDQLNSIG